VTPIYRDPVHDFGFLRFDPGDFTHTGITELKIEPNAAHVGVDIRVIGNHVGEKLSILSGVISRLDRNAPEYIRSYRDFNTNYIQSSVNAKGGSSGSPMVNIDGHVVGLKAGGMTHAAMDYFLPLDHVLHALDRIHSGNLVSRGTIQTQWQIKTFDDCSRLGLTAACEASIRETFPDVNGMLVAEKILPKGPAYGKILVGDILLELNGQLITQFVKLEDLLNSSIGRKIQLLVQRGSQQHCVECTVDDLHSITPDRFLMVAGGFFHNLSYIQAMIYGIPPKGVYVSKAAGSFDLLGKHESGYIIDSIDNKMTEDLDEFIKVIKTKPGMIISFITSYPY
jgi:pro-apoptotic serine protease NMA111